MPIYTAFGSDANDPGIAIKYKAFGADEYIVLRSVLTDDILDPVTAAANKTGTFSNRVFVTQLILAMVLDKPDKPGWRVKNASQKDTPWLPLTPSGLNGLSTQFRQWLQREINACDGSVAEAATLEVDGLVFPFREATGSVF